MKPGTHTKLIIAGIGLLLAVYTCTLLIRASAEAASGGMDHQSHLESQRKTQEDEIIQLSRSPVFSEFDAWLKGYLDGNNRGASETRKGQDLAFRRYQLFKQLMQQAPKVAIERAIPREANGRLPDSIAKNLERRISSYGDFLVYVVMMHDHANHHEMIGSRIEREVVFGGSRYKAFVYGRRETMTTKLGIPLQGIILDDIMAVDEAPASKLEPRDYESRNVDLAKLPAQGVAAEIGGQVEYFTSDAALESFVRQQIEWEAEIGPTRTEAPWTLGVKTVLFIRVDFPDRPGEPVDFSNDPLTITDAQNLINNEVSPFYVNSSYNQTSLQTTVTPVVRMPQPQSFYFNNVGALFNDAPNAARAAGYEVNNFNLDLIAMSYNSGFSYGGIARVGGIGAALNGAFSMGITAHELGHNYGLLHSNLWLTTDGSVIGTGSNLEYGNPFDVMGSGGEPRGHFNVQYKKRLNWLTEANVQNVTSDGVYRVVAHDSTIPGGIRALKIRKNSTKNYWIEFRQLYTNISSAMNGAMINWDYLSADFRETQLLDMTPASSSTLDSPLVIGQNFFDTENRIRFTVLNKGNTTPESLDVRVEFNVGCTFSLIQTNQSFSASGGEGSIAVNTSSGCRPPTSTNDSWLAVAPGDTTPVRYVVAANYDPQPRTGTINVAGQTFTVQQGAATTACVPRPSGLVAWWRGDGNALDQTGVNNGTLVNSMSFGGGKVGGGFLGDNSSSIVEVPDSSSLVLNHSLTLEGWLRFDAFGGTVIERRDNGSTGNFAASYHVSSFGSGELAFFVGFNHTQGIGLSSPAPLQLNQFTHFAVTVDDATSLFKLYINGSLVRQFTITQRPMDLDPNAQPKVNIGDIQGTTDELSAYNRALSATEIQSIYNAGVAPTGATGKCLSLSAAGSSAGLYNPATSTFFLRNSNSGGVADISFAYGPANSGWVPLVGDWDGNGTDTVGLYNPATGAFFLRNSNSTGVADISFAYGPGNAGWVPLVGDWNGDGTDTVGLFNPSSSAFFLRNSNSTGVADISFAYGPTGAAWVPIVGDWNGDGATTVGLYNPSSGAFFLRNSNSTGVADISFTYGPAGAGWVPIVGDWNGDGTTTVGLYSPSGAGFFLRNTNSTGVADISFAYGPSSAGWRPLGGNWDGS